MSSEVHPGPIVTDLLYLIEDHRAYQNFWRQSNTPDQSLKVRRCDQTLFERIRENPIPPHVMQYIRMAGFGGVFDCGFHKVDRALVTALIERWRPETHTFHLPIGECTITLQDIQVLWGLNVDGPVITGKESVNTQTICGLCNNYLGFVPPPECIRGYCINIPWLIQLLSNPLPNEPTDVQVQQRARIYIMILLGGSLFPDSSGHRVPIFYLYSLINLQQTATISWGSAVLAFLYRCLCRGSSNSVSEVYGPLVLLQYWAWERIPAFRPQVIRTQYNFQQVYATRLVFFISESIYL